MATQALMPEPMMPPPVSSGDRTPDNPNTQTPEQNQKAAGLTEQQKQNLIKVKNAFIQKWSFNHRGNARRVAKVFEYIRDRQYVYWDSFAGAYIDPFDESQQGTQQGNDDLGYRRINNVIQWLLRVFQSTLSPNIPKTIYEPVDAENDTDVVSAETASKAQANIERKNNINSLLLQELMYLFAAGNYFKYTRWVRDSDRAGVSREPVYTLSEEEAKPDRYVCHVCGTEVPAAENPTNCPQCGAPLDESDFHEALVVPMPKIVAMNEVPNGQVAFSIYNTLHVMCSPDATDPSIDPLNCTPILDLNDEVDLSALRAGYPEAWDMLKQAEPVSTVTGDNEYLRRLRTNNFTSTPGRAGIMNQDRPTLSRCWMRPWAFNVLDKKQDADDLRALFPDGCKLVTVNDKFLECVPEQLTDHWSWCGTMKGLGAYPPAIADPAMPFQDRINDAANNMDEYFARLAVPDVLANTDLIDVEAWNGTSMSGGGYKGVKPKKTVPNATLQSAFFQPEFHIDGKIFSYNDMLMQALQLLTGLVPQTYGGHQDGIDTFGGQKQALDVAVGILAIYWKFVTEEHSNASKLAIKCLVENATEDENNPVPDSDDGDKFKNDPIKVDNLRGEFNCYPDTEGGLPSTQAETRDRLKELWLGAKDNPVIMEAFRPMRNQRLAYKTLGPPGMEVPGDDTWKDVMQDIALCLQGEPLPPVPMPDPMTGQTVMVQMPTVSPAKEVYDMDIAEQACLEWLRENWHKPILTENPAGKENVLLYLKLCTQFKTEKAAAAMPPQMPPPGGAPPAQPTA